MMNWNLDGDRTPETPEKNNAESSLDGLKSEFYCFDDMKVVETLWEFRSIESLETGKYYFSFKEWVGKYDETMLKLGIKSKYIVINGRKYPEVNWRDKTTGRWYHIDVSPKMEVWSIYLWNFKDGIQNWNWVVVYSNWNRYEWEYKDWYPVKWRAKFQGNVYSVEYESGKWLKITSNGEYKGKYINLTESKFLD